MSLLSALLQPILNMKSSPGALHLLLIASVSFAFVSSAHAAENPPLGAASTYAILGSTFTNTTPGSLITGDIGFTSGPAVAPAGVHNNYGPGAPYGLAGINQGTALSMLAAEPCTFTFPAGAVNLSTETTHGPVGIYTAGVYCGSGAMNIGGPLTLLGNGTFIFRTNGALTSTAGAIVSLSGASACNVFWTPTEATTLAANTTFVGTVIANAGITVGANTIWSGRALAFGGTVTTDTVTIALCSAFVPASSMPSSAPSSSSISSSSSFSSSMSSSASSRSSSSVRSSSAPRSSVRSSLRSSSSSSSRSSSSRSRIMAPVVQPPDPPAATPPPPVPEIFMPVTGVDFGLISAVLGVIIAISFAHLSLIRR